jgi:hypothetical protein
MSTLLTSSGFRVGVLLGAVGAVSPAGGAPLASPAAEAGASGLAAQATTRAARPSGYTEGLARPTSPVTIVIPPESIPAGWRFLPTPITLKRALLENSQANQVVWCQYQTSHPDTVVDLRRTALPAPGSCIVNPTNMGFLCKPGSAR